MMRRIEVMAGIFAVMIGLMSYADKCFFRTIIAMFITLLTFMVADFIDNKNKRRKDK